MDAQKFMSRENDAVQREEMEVYREAWWEYEQLQVLCRREVGVIAVERSELASQKAELDYSAAYSLKQRDFDSQMIADAVEKHLRAQFESELARARSRAELCLHAYHEHKLQFIDVQNKLKSTEDKLKDAEARMLDDAKNAQQAIDAIFAEAQDREKEMAEDREMQAFYKSPPT